MEQPLGFMDVEVFKEFILQQHEVLEENLFHKYDIRENPRVVFCRLGEQLLHARTHSLVEITSRAGLHTHLVTDGTR